MKTILMAAMLLSAGVAASPAFAKTKIEKINFRFGDHQRVMYAVVPDRPDPMPLVVLLHGSGRDGEIMAQAWKDLANREGFIVAAPSSLDSEMWVSTNDPPAFFRTVVERMKMRHSIDETRIYLFGHSAGAAYALFLAIVESDLFAATAVHAGALQANPPGLFQQAQRKMPIAIWVGDHDPNFPVDVVEETRRVFETNGFPIKLNLLPHHDHNYYVISDELNSKAWQFLKAARMPVSSTDATQPD